MIPRTSIDEANKHLKQLHHRVFDLEKTVHEQNDTLQSKDRAFQNKISELTITKDKEIEILVNKLLASERTVSILQEELERKNHQISALQHSHSKLRRLLNFKDDIQDLLKTMEDAEENLALDEGDTDGLLSFYQRSNDVSSNLSGKKLRKKRFIRNENHSAAVENFEQSDIEDAPVLGGKEFYL
ncbi:vimentin-type intermediate filament-associated coiled-coil protein-like [Physella acuta]|uniref:vimentin-type intermediate filament-associated coiled-coil protein-like n=1 Tax=Physella acuta TaxID=109671 RepID=UPI0027DB4E61|nr:vimentin-type intermediate filament-associated coiled-coil protein-like [Physella acuta]